MKGNRKAIMITLLIIFLIVGGAGGYLLWRINQEKTVSPTDSDAGQCLDSVVTVDFYPFGSDDVGYVEEVIEDSLGTKVVKPIKSEKGYLRIILNNSCATGAQIRAVPKKGYQFSHWEELIDSEKPIIQSDQNIQSDETNLLKIKENPIQVKREHSSLKTGYLMKKDLKLIARFVPESPDLCKEVSVVYQDLTSPEGNLKISKASGNVVEKDNTIIQTFTQPSEIGSEIEAVPASGYKFKHWINAVSGDVVSTGAKIRKDAKEFFGLRTCIERSFSLILKAVFEEVADDGVDKTAKVIYQATPPECTKLLVCASPNEPRLTADNNNCLEQTASPNEHVMPISIDPSLDKECVFQHWLVNGNRDGSELKRHDRTGAAGSITTIVAVFKKETTPTIEKTYSLRYSTEGNGKLSRDGGTPGSDTISVVVKEGENGPSIRAIPNSGYVFAYWINDDTQEKETSPLATTNPRQDINVNENIAITAHYEKSGDTTPPEDGGTTPPATEDTTKPEDETNKDGLPGTAVSSVSKITILAGVVFLFTGLILGWPKVVETFLVKEKIPYVIHPEISSKGKSKKK